MNLSACPVPLEAEEEGWDPGAELSGEPSGVFLRKLGAVNESGPAQGFVFGAVAFDGGDCFSGSFGDGGDGGFFLPLGRLLNLVHPSKPEKTFGSGSVAFGSEGG